MPENFLEDFMIVSRINPSGHVQYCTGEEGGVLRNLARFKPTDAFCLIGVTNEDLFPNQNRDFCFGQTLQDKSVGAFSFHRYDPKFELYDGQEEISDTELMMRFCHVMVHEITHLFGLRHCIYYECLMNGTMTAKE